VHDRHTVLAGGADVVDGRLPVDEDGPGVRCMDAGQDLHQGRLAGTVLPGQCMHLARLQVEAHVVEHAHA
jgi:hypothetical protein